MFLRLTGTLTIDIINANNHAPRFLNVDGGNSVQEEELPGSLAMVVSAVDDDRDLVTYEIVSQTLPGAFSIQRSTG